MKIIRNITKLFTRIFSVEKEAVVLGSSYGRWAVIPELLSADSVIYSFGVGEDISFDERLVEMFGVKIHLFDPTPRSREWFSAKDRSDYFIFHPVGLFDFDGELELFAPKNNEHVSFSLCKSEHLEESSDAFPVSRLSTIMENLGDEKIDVLKMDIEGAEYQVITDMLSMGIQPKQLLIEFHDRFEGVGDWASLRVMISLVAKGYRVFEQCGPNEYCFVCIKK